MFLPKHPLKPATTTPTPSITVSINGQEKNNSNSQPKKRITPTYIDSDALPSSIITPPHGDEYLNNQFRESNNYNNSTTANGSGSGLFRNLHDDDAESIYSISSDDEEEEREYSTDEEDVTMLDENDNSSSWLVDEQAEDEVSLLESKPSSSSSPVEGNSNKRRKQQPLTTNSTCVIECVGGDELEKDNFVISNFDIGLLFASISHSKRCCTSRNTYSFHYLYDDIVLFQIGEALHFGKMNKCENMEKKLNMDMMKKFRSIDLNQFPQILQGDITIPIITRKTSPIKIKAPITINSYFKYDNCQYIIITNESTIYMYPILIEKINNNGVVGVVGEFLEPLKIFSQQLDNMIIDEYVLHGSVKNIIHRFNLKKMIKMNIELTPQSCTIPKHLTFQNFTIFKGQYLLSNNVGNNQLMKISSNSSPTCEKFNIEELIMSVVEVENFTFILTTGHIHVHNIDSIQYNIEDDQDFFMKMTVKKYEDHFLICTLSKMGFVDIYKFDDSEKTDKLSLEFRFELKKLSFFTRSNTSIECEYLNFIGKEIIICLKSGDLLRFEPYLFYDANLKISL